MKIIHGVFYLKSGNIIDETIEIDKKKDYDDYMEFRDNLIDVMDIFRVAKKENKSGIINFNNVVFDIAQIEAIEIYEEITDENEEVVDG